MEYERVYKIGQHQMELEWPQTLGVASEWRDDNTGGSVTGKVLPRARGIFPLGCSAHRESECRRDRQI